MRRIVIAATLVGVGIIVLRARVPKLHERLMSGCERMFERMPDTFPPKRAMRTIEDTHATTARILELLEARNDETSGPERREPFTTEAVAHAT